MLQAPVFQPKIVIIHRGPNQGFGFTLRHFIAYPPEGTSSGSRDGGGPGKAMETIFIKEVQPNGPAHFAGLQTGDRVLMVNNIPVAGISYSTVVTMIKTTVGVLRLQVVPKECDVLQMYYTDIAHNPESNRQQLDMIRSPTHNFQFSQKMIAMPETGTMHINKVPANEPFGGGPSRLVPNNEGVVVRAKPIGLPVLPGSSNETDFFIRIRKSIEQKEEFLKSPPYRTPPTSINSMQKQNMQLARAPISSDVNYFPPNSIVRFTDNLPSNKRDYLKSLTARSKISSIRDNLQRDPPFMELPEKGVTNQLFERKQVSSSHFKTLEHFKPLSINVASVKKAFFRTEPSDKHIESENRILSINQNLQEDCTNANINTQKLSLPVVTVTEEPSTMNYPEVSGSKILQKATDVVRRYKSIVLDDNKPMRRTSYLMATSNELDLSNEFCSTIEEDQIPRVEEQNGVNIEALSEVNGKIETPETEIYEDELEVKSAYIYGKRSSDYRSWRQSRVQLKDGVLKIYAGKNVKSNTNVIDINIKNFNILEEIKEEKKKFVFKLQLKPQATDIEVSDISDKCCEYKEISFKTKNLIELKKWISLLQQKASDSDLQNTTQGKQLAEPQKTAATSSVPTNNYCDENIQDYSPLGSSSTKGDNESDSASFQSPVMKSRKTPHQKTLPDKDLGSPKSKNWKDLLFRRGAGTSSDISAAHVNSPRLIGSIGVPLKSCPMSKDNEFVPLIVDVCTKIVESKGLNIIGIYRVPGNKAAISELTEQVNKSDFSWDKISSDDRWEDVNVVSSLLKLFIRSLPDALLPNTFYINFIEADKKIGERRLKELRHLLKELSPYSYETMKHLIRHLHRVSKHCDVNLMEPKNLAIIFGPSIIRTPNDTLENAVKDMRHQCRIVELLVSHYEYFFENGPLPVIETAAAAANPSVSQEDDQTSLLLDNVSKIEQRLHDKESITSRFIPHLRRRNHPKRSVVSSDTYSGESVLSLESKKSSPEAQTKDILHLGRNERSSEEVSIVLTDEDSPVSRISDSASMSLTTITDALESKLKSLRSASESDDSSPKTQSISRRNFPQPLVLHENIPYADESPERHLIPEGSPHIKNNITKTGCNLSSVSSSSRNATTKSNSLNTTKFTSSYESCSDDSEVSTTSDPRESLLISPAFLERYKKRRDYKLFRSASFNCRNYSTRHNNSNLTKDEKTDMNITKKRQIQNKQNRSIKRRHTVGGPHDYSTTITRRTNNDHVLEVGIRIKNVNRRS